ncbi:hypothetical protein [Enterobacter sp. DE0047]|uniref:DUF7079 family protein n=1 Tax=Enterobacter sp. DE0047 TaxID=2584949 RepID=UPI00336BBC06
MARVNRAFTGRDLQDYDYRWIAQVLKHSGLNREEIFAILDQEVAPALQANLLYNPTPIMEGWSKEDVEQLVTEYVNKKPTMIERFIPASLLLKQRRKSNPQVNMKMIQLSRIGRGLVVLSIAISIYEIYTADDKVSETGRQIAITGAGIAGAAASSAMAGLICGPGAPVCVLIGGFVGGALAAWEMGRLWD